MWINTSFLRLRPTSAGRLRHDCYEMAGRCQVYGIGHRIVYLSIRPVSLAARPESAKTLNDSSERLLAL